MADVLNAFLAVRPQGVTPRSVQRRKSTRSLSPIQPPGFGRVGSRVVHRLDASARAAERAIHSSQFDRSLATQRVGGRRAVVVE